MVANFDPRTGKYDLVNRCSFGNVPETDGIFAMLGGMLMALYPLKGYVVFRLGDKVFTLDEQTIIKVEGPDEHRLLRVIRDGYQIAEHVYAITTKRIEDDPTPMIDDEENSTSVFS